MRKANRPSPQLALVVEFKKASPDKILLKHMANQLLKMDLYVSHTGALMHSHTDKSRDKTGKTEEHAESAARREPVNRPATIVQCRFQRDAARQATAHVAPRHNATGMPDALKSGLEQLSGFDLSAVRVHYNSPKPAQVGALAYAQGTNIHLGPGQAKHLPHEGWHVVQQMQGRVRPTVQYKKTAINDEAGLEKEADVMGGKALQFKGNVSARTQHVSLNGNQPIQRVVMSLVMPGIGLTGNTLAKFNELLAAMNLLPIGPAAGIAVGVRVDDNHEPNPADTRRSNQIGIDIEVNLRKWYLDIASVGEIVGLIAHELGVHNLGDLMMSRRARRRERRRNAAGRGFQINVNGHQVGVAGWAAPVAHNRDARRRQRDHVNVVRDQGGVAGNASARTRAYVSTMLALGDNIDAGPGTLAERNQKLHDLIRTFLFDYARILVTDDGGAWATFSGADLISDVMQWYQGVVVARHVGAHPWLARFAVHVNSSGWGIRGWLLGKLAAYIANRGVTLVGRGLSTVGGAIAGAWNRIFG